MKIKITPKASAKLAQQICKYSTSLRMYFTTTTKVILGYRKHFSENENELTFIAPRYYSLRFTVYRMRSWYVVAEEGEEVMLNSLYDLEDLYKMHYDWL